MKSKFQSSFLLISVVFLFVFSERNLAVNRQTRHSEKMTIETHELGSTNFVLPAMGEPVPGCEVFIELEPDDQPIANIPTDGGGEVNFSIQIPPNQAQPTPPKLPKGIQLSIQFPEKIWKLMAEKYKRKDLFGTYSFQLVIKIGKAKYSKEFSKTIKSDADIRALANKKQDPIRQMFTSDEISANNTKEVIKVLCSITLLCLNVN